MGTLAPTTSERIVSALRASVSSPAYRWDELRSFLLLALRMERDAGLEIGTLVARRIDLEIVRIQEYASVVSRLATIPKQATLAPEELRRVAGITRSARNLSSPQVLAALEQDLRRLAGIAVRNGDAVNDAVEGIAAAEQLIRSWSNLVEAVEGAKALMVSLDRLPPIDSIYLLNRLSDWMQNATSEPDPHKRRDIGDALLAALAYVRSLRRSPVPDLDLPNKVSGPQGVCSPARRTGVNSGPFRVVVGSYILRCVTQYGTEDVKVQNLSETSYDLPRSAADGWHYLVLVQPGAYTCRLAGASWPGPKVTLTTLPVQAGSRITPESVRDAINQVAVSGISASVIVHADGSKNVRLSCSPPVSGPSGWFRFYDFSGSWMTTFFPGTVHTEQVTHAAELASQLALPAHLFRPTSETHVLFSGDLAYTDVADPSRIYIFKAYGTCTVSGNKVTTTSGSHVRAQVGDECVLMPGAAIHTVEEVLPDGLVVSGSPNPQSSSYSVSPVLSKAVAGTGVSLELLGRWYRFDTQTWIVDAVTGRRYIELGSRTAPDPSMNGPLPCSAVQEVLHVDSAGTTVDDWLQIPNWNDTLNVEIGFPANTAYAAAFEWRADVTAIEGFRSRVLPGDQLVDPQNNLSYDVVEVHDGHVVLGQGVGVKAMSSSAKFVNATRSAWDVFVAALAQIPDFDAERFAVLINQVRGGSSPGATAELVSMASSIASSLSQGLPVIRAYTGRTSRAPTMKIMLSSLRRSGLDRVYDRLQRGDLGTVLTKFRSTSTTGDASEQGGGVARDLRLDLTLVERVVLGAGD